MSKFTKVLLMCTAYVLVAALAIGGTIAYLTSEDSDVNVMTLGNVSIEQFEMERAFDANGNVTGMKTFTQGQPLYPAVVTNGSGNEAWAPNPSVDLNYSDYIDGAVGGNGTWLNLNNVMDKFVFVKNTGKTDAYYRTIIACEAETTVKMVNDYNQSMIHFNVNGNDRFDWVNVGDTTIENVEINGVKYNVMAVVYKEVLKPGEISRPSLLQVGMDQMATNEYVAQFGETFDILVLSQAVQAAGFDNAATALDTGFGEVNAANVQRWFGGMVTSVSTLDELQEAFKTGGTVILTDDIEFEKITAIEPGADVYLNLNGKTITVDQNTQSNTLIWVKEGAKLTIDGNGTIDLGGVSTMAIFCPYGELVIENGTFIRDKVETVTNKTTGLFMGAKITASNVTINGGYFDPGYYDTNANDIEGILAGTVEFTETADDIAKRGNSKDANLVRVAIKDNVSVMLNHSGYGSFKVYGGTFVGANPAWGDEGCMLPTTPNYLRPWSYYQGALLDGQVYDENGVVLPYGYTINRSVNADGVPVYTVTYSK